MIGSGGDRRPGDDQLGGGGSARRADEREPAVVGVGSLQFDSVRPLRAVVADELEGDQFGEVGGSRRGVVGGHR